MGTILETVFGVIMILVALLALPAMAFLVAWALAKRKEAASNSMSSTGYSGRSSAGSLSGYPDSQGRMFTGDHTTAERAAGMHQAGLNVPGFPPH